MEKPNELELVKLGRSCLYSFLVSATATYFLCALLPKKKLSTLSLSPAKGRA